MNLYHIPIYSEQCIVHKKLAAKLKTILETEQLSVIIYGASHSGKTSLVQSVLSSIYSDYKDCPMLSETISIDLDKKSCKENILIRKSINVIELHVNTIRKCQSHIIQDIVKSISINNTVYMNTRIIVLYKAEFLTVTSQNLLRRLIEKYTQNIKLIFIVNRLHAINITLMSRCLCFRVCVDESELLQYINHVNSVEKLGHNISDINAIVASRDLCLTHSFLWNKNPHISYDQSISSICKLITQSHCNIIDKMPQIRTYIYAIQSNLYSDSTIIIDILRVISIGLNTTDRLHLTNIAASHEHLGKQCNKWLYVIELFILNIFNYITNESIH